MRGPAGKWTEAPRCRSAPAFLMAVSRILSSPGAFAPEPVRPFVLSRALRAGQSLRTATITRRPPVRLRGPERAGNPDPPVLSCTAWGFSCPAACAAGGGLLSRLFTLTPGLAPGGGLFSVTLSVGAGFRPRLPRVLRGMLPYGVRTFLSARTLRPARSGRPPSGASLIPRGGSRKPGESQLDGPELTRACVARPCEKFLSGPAASGLLLCPSAEENHRHRDK